MCSVHLGEKIRLLRSLEGNLRGLNRPLAKSELVRLIREDLGETISPAYLSQLESGKRPHMTEKTRDLLARFFKVHPGYLVSDPEGFGTQVTSLPMAHEARVDEWLERGAEFFRGVDPGLSAALRMLAEHTRSRDVLVLVADLVGSPGAVEQLRSALSPAAAGRATPRKRKE